MTQSKIKKNAAKRDPWKFWLFFFTAAAIIVITAFGLIPKAYRGSDWSADVAAKYGDFVGGYFGTVFLVISLALVVVSYRGQKRANDLTLFESRFFELLRYHRENTLEIEIDQIRGRRAFVSFIREWRLLLKLVEQAELAVGHRLTVCERSAISYLAFFHGSGPNGRRSFEEAAIKRYSQDLVIKIIGLMSNDWGIYKRYSNQEPERDRTMQELSSGIVNPESDPEKLCPLAYVPFEGHHSRLAHYFRHLFHVINYAEDHAPGASAQEYVDLVTAQLTTHEQAVLALHASSYEGEWRDGILLQKFHLIKDLPKGFLKSEEFDVRAEFPLVNYVDA
jgi:hypothetical protein